MPLRQRLSASIDPWSSDASVNFFDGANHIGGALARDQLSVVWSNATFGTHALRAVANNDGVGATSTVVHVTIEPGGVGIVTNGAQWRYHDHGVDLATAWRGTNYDDSHWPSGIGLFGFGDWEELTTFLRSSDTNNQPIGTFYFRHLFLVSDPSLYSNLVAWLVVDDGAVIYLNEQEWYRHNMPAGEINYRTPAVRAVARPEQDAINKIWLDPNRLRPGLNTIAVELHNASTNNQDVRFDLALVANAPFSPPPLRAVRWAGTDVRISWPMDYGGFVLQYITNLGSDAWETIPTPLPDAFLRQFVVREPAIGQRFYRLAWP